MPNISNKNDFEESLTELAEFKEYFTDDEKIKLLVEWIHYETGLNRTVARLAVKRIAPFLMARLVGLGKAVGETWMKKLNSRLYKFDWYFNLSQTLLNILKTRTDTSFEAVLAKPNANDLEALINDRTRWENLKPEYQGLVQLLFGQSTLVEGQSGIKHQLDQVMQELSFDLDLKTPDYIVLSAKNAKSGSALWLTYAHRQASLIGRANSLKQLDEYFDQDNNFSWWVITGAGGVGKSRLALEALISRQLLWEVGFLSLEKLKKIDALTHWKPAYPTIIVIDYAAEYPTEIGNWIDHLIKHQDEYDFPVRLLILERENRQQNWWEQLVPASSDGLLRKDALYTQQPHRLEPLSLSQQQEALQTFIASLDVTDTKLPDEDNSFWDVLDELSDHGKPLFLGMVAVAITNHGINKIRQWDQQELLDYVLNHERKMWDLQLVDYEQQKKEKILNMLALSTMCSGFNWSTDEDEINTALLESGVASDINEIKTMWNAIQTITGSKEGYLQPDIFAEYFVLKHWQIVSGEPLGLIKSLVNTSFQLSPENTFNFIRLSATDYPERKTAWFWWDILRDSNNDNEQNELVIQLAISIAGQLKLYGKYEITLDRWLLPLQVIEEPILKARVLNLIGTIKLNISNYETALKYLEQSLAIRQEIGDKSGEGTTLNNISQIYDARGDYETALKYLEQSLAIQQEIGDKSGEGTTLNNISQIYDARGDYETALKYLEQSLAIRQEIGDMSGISITLINIGHIYVESNQYKVALEKWIKSYDIAKQIKLAQPLEALGAMAEQLDLPNGLESWNKSVDELLPFLESFLGKE